MLTHGFKPSIVLGLLAGLLLVAGAQAKPVPAYVVEHDGVRLEITAPRADILRVRAGQSDLPEDASWAVPGDVRAAVTPLDVTETADAVELRTPGLVVHLDPHTLAIRVETPDGQVVLDDARGSAVAFQNGGFRLRKAMPEDVHFFGLGDKTGPMDRRDQAFTLWDTDSFAFTPSTDPIYKSIPFVIGTSETGRSFGLFLDNTWRGFFDFGKTERDAWAFGAEGGGVDYYIMAGPDAKSVIRQYAYLTGTAPLTPLWALGFQQSHWSYETQDEVMAIADRLRKDRLPADVVYMDIDYQDRNRPFTVNTKAFPDMAKLVADLKARGLNLVLITDLHIADAPDQGYAPYDTGKAQDIFLKKPDGTDYVGKVWPGPAVFPDFSRPKARDWWGRQYSDFVKLGVAGFWNDMNEPAIFEVRSKTMPLDNVHRIEEPGFAARNASHAEMHNVYGMLNSRATYEGVLKLAPDRRPFVLTRASYAGGQRYAATWTGDNVSSWAHLRLSTSMLVNLGLSGFAYAGDDIGGFAGDQPSPDLLTRWIEIGAFNPIFRDHYTKGKPAQEAWVSGPEHEDIRRRYIEERYRLMPYIYGLAEENSRTGLPIMRPVFLEFPQVLVKGEHLGGTDGWFMLGDDLLVAPAPTGESAAPYVVGLPDAGWYDYWSGDKLATAETTETPKLDRLPVFVRPGAILPRQPLVQSTSETPQGPLEIAVYPGPDCHGSLYFDDGVSFAYKRGQYLRQAITCAAAPNSLTVTIGARTGQYKPWWKTASLSLYGVPATATARLNGKPVASRYDAAQHRLVVDITDMARGAALTVATP